MTKNDELIRALKAMNDTDPEATLTAGDDIIYAIASKDLGKHTAKYLEAVGWSYVTFTRGVNVGLSFFEYNI